MLDARCDLAWRNFNHGYPPPDHIRGKLRRHKLTRIFDGYQEYRFLLRLKPDSVKQMPDLRLRLRRNDNLQINLGGKCLLKLVGSAHPTIFSNRFLNCARNDVFMLRRRADDG